jgi:tRNA dimethylallyltransferase
MNKIIIITGQTATGKTDLAIKLAQYYNTEIINADAVIFYKYMDIGGAKPTTEELSMAKHHLIGIKEPHEEFTANNFMIEADKLIKELHQKNKIPIIVGGSQLYIKALLYGFFKIPDTPLEIKEKWRTLLKEHGSLYLHQELEKIDPESAKRLHQNDSQRLERALEVYETTGKTISEYQKEHQFKDLRYDYIKFATYYDREELYQRVNKRVDIMMDLGLLEEVKILLKMNYTPKDTKVMKAIAYPELTSYINNELTLEEAIDKIKQHTRNFAKRQTTGLKSEPEINWLTKNNNLNDAIKIINNWIN